jgi:hypothetical protein
VGEEAPLGEAAAEKAKAKEMERADGEVAAVSVLLDNADLLARFAKRRHLIATVRAAAEHEREVYGWSRYLLLLL